MGSLITHKNDDGTLFIRFVPKVSGLYNISVAVKAYKLHKNPFSIQVKERGLRVVSELDLKGQILHSPSGIAVNSKGLIAVTDFCGDCILMFDNEGKYFRKFAGEGMKAGEISGPSGLTFVDDDNILVAEELNHRIQQFDVQTGNAVKSFDTPVSICMNDEGRLAVSDFGNNRIQVFTKDGELLFIFGDSGSEKLNYPTGCIFHGNRFIISDPLNHCLKVFDRSGRFLRKIESQGTGYGQLKFSCGLCVETCCNHSNILVCDFELCSFQLKVL